MQAYNKAIAAFFSQVIVMLTAFGFDRPEWLSDDLVTAAAIIVSTLAVYLVPNRKAKPWNEI